MAPNYATLNSTVFIYDLINNMLSLPVMFKLEANRENQRFYSFTRLKLGDNLKKIHDDLKYVYSDQALPYNTCARWVRKFQNQNNSLVTHQLTYRYIHQGQRMRGLFSRSHQWCESRDAILRTFNRGYSRYRECIPIPNSFRKETMPISISPSIWDLEWFNDGF